MPQIFISYARSAEAEVRTVVGWLEGAGYDVWWDRHLLANRSFSDAIEEQLDASDMVLVLWSKDAAASEWVRAEADFARHNKKLVQASIDGTLPPLPFNQFHCEQIRISRNGDNSEGWNKLLDAFAHRGAEAPYQSRSIPTQRISRRSALAMGGVGSLVIAAGSYAMWSSGLIGGTGESKRLAVMPFRVIGDGAAQSRLAEGFAIEIRSILARNPLLHVAARVSSDAFRDQTATAGEICEKLNVDYLLNGDIGVSEGRLVGSAELAEGAAERIVRPFDIDAPLDSLLTIQQSIASQIIERLSGAKNAGISKTETGGTTNVAAYDAFLRGRELYEAGTSEATDRAALAEFENAIRLDPEYAAAFAMRGRTLGLIGNLYGSPDDHDTVFNQAITSAQRAIEIAPRFADGYAVLGFIRFNRQLDVKAAKEPYQRAFELGTGDADILSRYANFCGRCGQFALAREAINAAISLDPLNARVFRFLGNIEYGSGNYEAAIRSYENAQALQNPLSSFHYLVGLSHLAMGDLGKAKRNFEAEDFFVWNKTGLAVVEAKLGNESAARAHLAELKDRQKDKSNYQYLQVHAQLGEREAALAAMNEAWRVRDAGLTQINNDPLLDPLRDHPEFNRLLSQIGFAD